MNQSPSRAARSDAALKDLAACSAWAAGDDRHLLLHDSVADHFDIPSDRLPTGVIDGVATDAVGRALADGRAILVVVGGIYVTRARDPRERGLPVRAELGISRLSGGYFGLKVTGLDGPMFRGGVLDAVEEVDATLVTRDGVAASVVRTTAAWAVVTGRHTIRTRSRQEAYRRLLDGGDPRNVFRRDRLHEVTSSVHDPATLAEHLVDADVSLPASILLNGEQWTHGWMRA